MTHVLQVLFLSVFILQVVMHGEESIKRHLDQPEHSRCLDAHLLVDIYTHVTNTQRNLLCGRNISGLICNYTEAIS
jgi:hypothetical protein